MILLSKYSVHIDCSGGGANYEQINMLIVNIIWG